MGSDSTGTEKRVGGCGGKGLSPRVNRGERSEPRGHSVRGGRSPRGPRRAAAGRQGRRSRPAAARTPPGTCPASGQGCPPHRAEGRGASGGRNAAGAPGHGWPEKSWRGMEAEHLWRAFCTTPPRRARFSRGGVSRPAPLDVCLGAGRPQTWKTTGVSAGPVPIGAVVNAPFRVRVSPIPDRGPPYLVLVISPWCQGGKSRWCGVGRA